MTLHFRTLHFQTTRPISNHTSGNTLVRRGEGMGAIIVDTGSDFEEWGQEIRPGGAIHCAVDFDPEEFSAPDLFAALLDEGLDIVTSLEEFPGREAPFMVTRYDDWAIHV